MLPDDSIHVLSLNIVSENSFPDSAIFVYNYTLELHHTLTEQGYPRDAEGRTEFTLIYNTQTGYWYISRWIDTRIADIETWSHFKAAFGK